MALPSTHTHTHTHTHSTHPLLLALSLSWWQTTCCRPTRSFKSRCHLTMVTIDTDKTWGSSTNPLSSPAWVSHCGSSRARGRHALWCINSLPSSLLPLPPTSPGVLLSDLEEIDNSHSDSLPGSSPDVVNFEKRRLQARIVYQLQRHQSIPYNLARVEVSLRRIAWTVRREAGVSNELHSVSFSQQIMQQYIKELPEQLPTKDEDADSPTCT